MIADQLPHLPQAPARDHIRPSHHTSISTDRGSGDVGVLLQAVAGGDTQAFEALYENTVHRVYGLVRKVLIDQEISAETTQDVFLALWAEGAARFDPAQGSGMSWIMVLAHRRAVDRVRSEHARRARDLAWGIRNHDSDHDHVVETVLHHSEAHHVRSCLDILTEKQREAINLAYYGEMTYTDVAEHLAVPVSTVKTRIRDAITRLRSCLQPPT